MARMFLVRSFAVLGGLVLILQTLDLLGESGNILAYPGNGDAAAVALRVAARAADRRHASCRSRCCSAR